MNDNGTRERATATLYEQLRGDRPGLVTCGVGIPAFAAMAAGANAWAVLAALIVVLGFYIFRREREMQERAKHAEQEIETAKLQIAEIRAQYADLLEQALKTLPPPDFRR